MNWLEVSVPAGGAPEDVIERLEGLGISGFSIEDEADLHAFLEGNTQYWDFVDEALEQRFAGRSVVKLWLPDDEAGRETLAQIEAMGLGCAARPVRDEDWENNWRDYYRPVPVGEGLVIVPEWQDYDGQRRAVRLDPGLLFGTGDHPTTRLCLEAVEQLVQPGCRVLDLGCGSGILGIAAAVLGAEAVTAVDVDDKAPDIVRQNAALNGVADRFAIHVGDVTGSASLRAGLGGGYDLVTANIVADVIIALGPYIGGYLAPAGRFVCSGIIDGREAEVEQALARAGLAICGHTHLDTWHCYICEGGQKC